MELELNLKSFRKSAKKFISIVLTMMLILTSLLVPLSVSAKDIYVTPDSLVTDGDMPVGENNEVLSDITVGETKRVDVYSYSTTYLAFTPESSGIYTFYSSSSSDTYGYLFDANKSQITYDDDDGVNNNFSITYELQGGVTYYWGVRYYNQDNSGSFDVTLVCDQVYCDHLNTTSHEGKEATCTEDGYTAGLYCNDCEMWIEGHEIINATGHTDENNDAICDVCETEFPLIAEGTCGDNVNWYFYENGLLEISGMGDMENYEVEDEENLAPWLILYHSVIKTVVIGDGITSIGNGAFIYCEKLTSITIPDSVTSIGYAAFVACGLTSITIPDSVTSLGDFAFGGSGLTSITIPDSVTSIGLGAFIECPNLTSVTISNSVTSIGDYAFGACGLTSITIPDSVTSIGDYAFGACYNLESVIIGNSVTSIGEGAFIECNLSHILYTGTEEQWNSITIREENYMLINATKHYNAVGDEVVCVDSQAPTCTQDGHTAGVYCNICESWLCGNETIGKVDHTDENDDRICDICEADVPIYKGTCGDNVRWSLYGSGLLEITGTGNMTSWSSYSNVPWYSHRSNIKSVVIEDGVTSIGNYAFYSCDSLTSVTIPDSVTSIGYRAFYNCYNISSAYYDGSNSDWNKISIDSGNSYLTNYLRYKYYSGTCGNDLTFSIDTDTGVLEITGTGNMWDYTYSYDYYYGYYHYSCDTPWYSYRDYIKTVVIGDGVTRIGDYAFYDCYNLESVTVPDSLLRIGNNAFTNTAYYNDSRNWTDDVLYIGDYLVKAQTSLSGSYTIKDGTKVLGDYAFYNCDNLTNVIMPDSVINIGSYVFYDCYYLKSVKISDSVKRLGGHSFRNCYNLTSITIPDSVKDIADKVFYYCSNLTEITIGNSLKTIGKNTFSDSGITSIIIPDSVTSMGDHAFYNCRKLTSVTIGNSLRNISNYTFYNCDSLTSITVPDTITSIGDGAFYDCDGITSIIIPDSVTSIGDYAFGYCDKLASVIIGDGVICIGDYAFYSCDNLTSIIIGKSVTSIGNYAFNYCYNLGLVCYNGSEEEWDEITIGNGNYYLTSAEIFFNGSVSGACGEKLTWTFDIITGTLNISGIGDMYNWSSYSETPWDRCRNAIKKVIIEDGITNIGDYAFYNCYNLTDIMIPDSVTSIGNFALYNCDSLTSITIPDVVVSVGDSAFYDCDGLTSVVIPDSVTNIGDTLFYSCGNLTSVTIGNSVTKIGDYTFYNCDAITNIKIPNSVTSIGYKAFYDCDALTSITIPASVTYIGDYAFYDCDRLKTVTIGNVINGNVTSGNVTDGNATDGDVASGNVTDGNVTDGNVTSGNVTIGDYAFYDCNRLTSVGLSESVTSIGYYAFGYCYNLRYVYYGGSRTKWTKIKIGSGNSYLTNANIYYNQSFSFGENLTWKLDVAGVLTITGTGDMDDWLYYYDTPWYYYRGYIKSVVIGDGVTSIGDYAFYGCYNLASITIGNSVTSIGDYAFYCCNKLTSITIPDSVTHIGDYVFACDWEYTSSLASITFGNSVATIGEGAFYYCDRLTSITIPAAVTSIGSNAFYGCSNIENVYITDIAVWCNIVFGNSYSNPMRIAENLYLNGELVREIVVPDSVTRIGDYAFYNCNSLTSITIGNSVTSIGDYAFYYCNKLTSITIPDSVTSIGDYAFCDCYSLTSITIPYSVTHIGDYAFYDCDNLTNVHITDIAAWCNIVFENVHSTPMVASYYVNLYLNGELVKDLVIPDSVTKIGDYAFYSCRSIKDITIPDSVTKIGNLAFCNTAYYNESSNWTDGILYIDNHLIKADSSFYYGEYKIRNNTKTIAACAFEYCDGLTSVIIPSSLTNISYRAFYDCDGLTEVTIAGPVTSIEEYAFGGCSGLRTVRFPCTLSNIKMHAFDSCNVLKNVYYDGSEADWEEINIEDYNDALDTANKNYNTHVHSEIIIKEPTCTETGVKNLVCLCGDTSHTEIIPAHGHDYQLDGSIIPSCTVGGYAVHLCGYCNDYKVETIIAKGHSYEFVTITKPTCTTEGTGINKCSDCGAEGEEETIPALGHEYYIVDKIDATCTDDGYERYWCLRCIYSHTKTIPALGHNYIHAGTVDANCTDEGYEIFKCENCKDYQLNIIPTNGTHNYDENGSCVYCGGKEESTLPVVGAAEGMSTIIDTEKKVISGLSENLTAESIMEFIAVSDDVTVSFSNDVIGTGTVIILSDKDGNELDSYTAVVFGDYNGDGVADTEDTAYFASIANFEIFDYYDYEYLFLAADINGDGVVDSMDEEDMYAVANFEAYIDYTITEGSKVVRY